jgi:Family of unknown function (DUF6455)
MLDLQKTHSPLEAIWQWCRGLTGDRSGLADCGEEVLERMAHDVGVSSSELGKLASHGPESADLLLRRMDALDLDQNEVARTERATFQDLQRVCTMCDCQRRCARDLARDPGDSAWQDYCPNAQTLTALNALPWMTRREW